jgi:hypothetical protein
MPFVVYRVAKQAVISQSVLIADRSRKNVNSAHCGSSVSMQPFKWGCHAAAYQSPAKANVAIDRKVLLILRY